MITLVTTLVVFCGVPTLTLGNGIEYLSETQQQMWEDSMVQDPGNCA